MLGGPTANQAPPTTTSTSILVGNIVHKAQIQVGDGAKERGEDNNKF